MATRGRTGIIEGAFERQSAVDMRMQRERMHTVLSSKRSVEIVDGTAVAVSPVCLLTTLPPFA